MSETVAWVLFVAMTGAAIGAVLKMVEARAELRILTKQKEVTDARNADLENENLRLTNLSNNLAAKPKPALPAAGTGSRLKMPDW